MIRRLQITDFFGVQGNTKQIVFENGLTIMVGKNGSGKTTILNMLHALLTSSFNFLSRFSFGHMEVEADGGLLTVERLPEGLRVGRYDPHRAQKPLVDRVVSDENEWQLSGNECAALHLGIEALYFPTYRRLEMDFDRLFDDLLEPKPWGYPFFRSENEALRRLRNLQTHSPWFLATNPAGLPRTVIGLSRKDIEQIVKGESERVESFERERLNKLIRDFVASLIARPAPGLGFDQRGRDELYHELYGPLSRTGLTECLGDDPNGAVLRYVEMVTESLERVSGGPASKKRAGSSSNDAVAALMNIMSYAYVTRFLQMYREARSQIEEHQAPLRGLLDLLSGFLDKPVILKDGRLVFSEDGKLGFEHLSAGEKQLVTLFAYTKLATKPGGLILIDEPELSLHVEWQRALLSSLLSGSTGVQYLVATHSPMIIAGHRDRVVSIGAHGDGEGA